MSKHKNTVPTFPSVRVSAGDGCHSIEVTLIAQLGHGSGDSMYASSLARQKEHHTFVDALNEPSARLGSTDFEHGDATALHSFAVGLAAIRFIGTLAIGCSLLFPVAVVLNYASPPHHRSKSTTFRRVSSMLCAS